MTLLEKVRKEKGLRKCDLSRISGINHCQITTYENGYGRPSMQTAQRLASALGVKIDAVFPQYKEGDTQ